MLQIQLRVDGRRCLVVGGGKVGTRRVLALLAEGAVVTVVDPNPSPELVDLDTGSEQPNLRLLRREFEPADVADEELVVVVAATDNRSVNESVSAAARSVGIPVNRCDDVDRGDLAFPAVLRRGPVSIAVATTSESSAAVPALARWLARRLDDGLDQVIGLDGQALSALAGLLAEAREEQRRRVTNHLPRESGRGANLGNSPESEAGEPLDWHSLLDASILELVQAGRIAEAKERIFACL